MLTNLCLAQYHLVFQTPALGHLAFDHLHLIELADAIDAQLVGRPQPQLLSLKDNTPFGNFPLPWDELKFRYSEKLGQFYIWLLSGIEVEEELHVFAGALPELSLVEDDVTFEELLGVYCLEDERDLLLSLRGYI